MSPPVIVRYLGTQEYVPVWQAMRTFSHARGPHTPDEIWLLEHRPVFTLGVSGQSEHLRKLQDIPVVHVDRGGQVTYHGPGQLIAYTLLDLRRLNLGVRRLVSLLEESVIALLQRYAVRAQRREKAPGVYVEARKIASLGLRVRQGNCYHGLSLNIAMNLEPFQHIDPCGQPDLQVTQLSELVSGTHLDTVATELEQELLKHLGYSRQDPVRNEMPAFELSSEHT